MDRVFPALQDRFDGDKELKKLGRHLFEGTGGDHHTPFVTVELTGTEDFDGFDHDATQYALQFRVVTDGTTSRKHHQLVRALRRVFDDAKWSGGDFTCTDMRRIGTSGPNQVDEGQLWESFVNYELFVDFTNLEPATRGV